MTIIRRNIPKQAPEGSFDFVYPLMYDGRQIAEIEGRCTVEYDGSLEIEVFELGVSYQVLIGAEGQLKNDIEIWLLGAQQAELSEAHEEMRLGRLSHDREHAAECRREA